MIRKITIAMLALAMLMAPFAGVVAADYSDVETEGTFEIEDETVVVNNETATLFVDLEFADDVTEYGDVFVEVFDENSTLVDSETVTPTDDGNESVEWDTDTLEDGEYYVVISTNDDDGGAVDTVDIGTLDDSGEVIAGAGSGSGLWAESIPGGQTTLILGGFGVLLYVYWKQDR